jgi:hypothetical protein
MQGYVADDVVKAEQLTPRSSLARIGIAYQKAVLALIV